MKPLEEGRWNSSAAESWITRRLGVLGPAASGRLMVAIMVAGIVVACDSGIVAPNRKASIASHGQVMEGSLVLTATRFENGTRSKRVGRSQFRARASGGVLRVERLNAEGARSLQLSLGQPVGPVESGSDVYAIADSMMASPDSDFVGGFDSTTYANAPLAFSSAAAAEAEGASTDIVDANGSIYTVVTYATKWNKLPSNRMIYRRDSLIGEMRYEWETMGSDWLLRRATTYSFKGRDTVAIAQMEISGERTLAASPVEQVHGLAIAAADQVWRIAADVIRVQELHAACTGQKITVVLAVVATVGAASGPWSWGAVFICAATTVAAVSNLADCNKKENEMQQLKNRVNRLEQRG